MMTSRDNACSRTGTDSAAIERAAIALRAGGLVAFPTETVYGLGADATSPEAVARIYEAKGRPIFNPLIAHVPARATAEAEGVFSPRALLLADAFWPGPLTLVLPRRAGGRVCDLACAGLDSIGLRVPGHPVALALLAATERPLAAPSANRSGRISPTDADAVSDDLGSRLDLVLDGGPCSIGIESTILACLDDRLALLRPGAITPAEIEAVAGPLDHRHDGGATIIAPGMLLSHYAPRARVRLDASAIEDGEVALDFAGSLGHGQLDLSPTGDLRDAAANLYRYLRRLDAGAPRTIAVAPVPQHGLGAAINDRLRRAAAPRG